MRKTIKFRIATDIGENSDSGCGFIYRVSIKFGHTLDFLETRYLPKISKN